MAKIVPFKLKDQYRPYHLFIDHGKVSEVISYPFYVDYDDPTNDEINVMVRNPGDPTTIRAVAITDLKPFNDTSRLKVRCDRDGTEFMGRPRPYPAATYQMHNHNTSGDWFIECPTCNRRYFLYDYDGLRRAIADKSITGFTANPGDFICDRVLEIIPTKKEAR